MKKHILIIQLKKNKQKKKKKTLNSTVNKCTQIIESYYWF